MNINNKPYRFSGISDFIAGEGVKPSFAVKIPGLYFMGRLVDALSQIPEAKPSDWPGMYAVADEAITALKAAVITAEAAYAEVLEACPLPLELKAEATTEPKPKAKI